MIAALYLASGIILFALGGYADDMLNIFCTGNKYQNTQYFADTIRKVDIATANWTSMYMCTDFCPCPSDKLSGKPYQYRYLDETKNNAWNRTIRTNNTNSKYTKFNFTDSLDQAYFRFTECYDDILLAMQDNTTN